MPNFSIIYTDLRNMIEEKTKLTREHCQATQQKYRIDTGLKKNEDNDSDEDGKKQKAGATIDPKNITGNCQLYKHTTEFQMSKLQDYKPQKSQCLKRNKKKKNRTKHNDDFGMETQSDCNSED